MELPRKYAATKKRVDGHHSVKRKTAELTPTRASPKLVLRSVGEDAESTAIHPDELKSTSECRNYRRKVDTVDTHGRLESGSGSGEQDGGQHDDGIDNGTKKRRTRRGKPKNKKFKAYSKLISLEEKISANRQPPAPYNTTQFLMADHSDLPDLEQKLSKATSLDIPASLFQKPATRTRDSSFSIDSNDDEYFYSSPEDEEEFLTKEFSSAYEALREERLNSLTKSELLQEYRLLEAKLETLTKRLRNKSTPQLDGNDGAESKNVPALDAEIAKKDSESKNTSNTDIEVTKKLKLCQQRVDDLIQKTKQLSQENEQLRKYAEEAQRLRKSSSESTIDTECDSSDSDSSTSSDSSRNSCSGCSFVSSTQTSPNRSYKSRLDNNKEKTGDRIDSCETSQSGSPRTCTTPTNFSNGLTITNETGGLPT